MNIIVLGGGSQLSILTALALLADATNQITVVSNESEPYPEGYPTQSGKQKAQWKQEIRGKKIK